MKGGVVCMGGVSYSGFWRKKKSPQAKKIKPDFRNELEKNIDVHTYIHTCTSMFYVFTLYCKRRTVETILVSFIYMIKTGCLWILLWLSLAIIIKIS